MAPEPLLTEDVMLLLHQPASGAIAGENVLHYVLGSAALTDLARTGLLDVTQRAGSSQVVATGDDDGSDAILSLAHSALTPKPRDVHTAVALVGPKLRGPVLDRLVERGDLGRERRRVLGILPSTKYTLTSRRRDELMERVRSALVDGTAPEPRIGASIALISASGTLPQFHREIPWSGDVYTRAKELERADWSAMAASAGVAGVVNAVITNAVVAAAVLPSTQ
ncbi:hypothetical protein BJF85_17415 [Saccharomonospora sp. CUA-673]|nr:hypothetical protein BJF85_17415 [Saccharomonospora sp. CUA-673]